MIWIHEITKVFQGKETDVHAVNGVSLSIAKGEIYGIVGYSGAGKSTLVRCINFLEKPERGSIRVEGFGQIEARDGRLYYSGEGQEASVPVTEKHLKQLRQGIGMIFQHFNLMDRSTVFENVAYALKYSGMKKPGIRERVLELLDLVDLRDKVNAYPSELSGGQKQRVAIARALANHPQILLSDEATSALDPEATESILKLLKDLNQRLGLTIVLITHEMAVVKAICDRMAVMEKGRVVEEGSVYDVFSDPQQTITRHFVESASGLGNVHKLIESGSPLIGSSNGVLVKCIYGRESVGDALISEVSRRFGVNMNIVLANVELLQDSPLGGLIMTIGGRPEDVEAAIRYMRECKVKVEVIDNGRVAE